MAAINLRPSDKLIEMKDCIHCGCVVSEIGIKVLTADQSGYLHQDCERAFINVLRKRDRK